MDILRRGKTVVRRHHPRRPDLAEVVDLLMATRALVGEIAEMPGQGSCCRRPISVHALGDTRPI